MAHYLAITLILPPAQVLKLEKLAKEKHKDREEIAEMAVAEYLKDKATP